MGESDVFVARSKRNAEHLISGRVLAFDTETTGLEAWHGDLPFAFSFCNEKGETAYVEFPVDPFTRKPMYGRAPGVFKEIKAILEDPAVAKVMHNGKFDVRMCEKAGIRVRGQIHETMFAAHACNTLEPSYALKFLARKYLEIGTGDQKDLQKLVVRCRRQAKKLGWNIAEDCMADYWLPRTFFLHQGPKLKPAEQRVLGKQIEACQVYCTQDAVRTMLLWKMYEKAMATEQVRDTYDREMELWPYVYEMEGRGVLVNLKTVQREIDNNIAELKKWRPAVERKAWPEFNINSPFDLRKLLYDELGLPVKSRTAKKGEPAVDVDALSEHASHPVVQALFKYRAAEKALGSFFYRYKRCAIPDPLNPGGYVLHPDFQQVGPVTGRFSCRNPNLQNVPNALTTRSSEPIQARTPFEPRPGYSWYHVDYHQLEALIFADVAQEQTMLAAIKAGRDLHTECTNKAWGGKDNPAAIRAAIHALELDGTGQKKNEHVQKLWAKWKVTDPLRLTSDARERFARSWMESFGWDIVKAEKSLEKKTSRAKAKMILFAKVFGGGPNAIKDLLKCTFAEAQQFMRDYDVAFPQIGTYIRELSNEARRNGFIRNRYNRRITVDPDKAYRAVNYMVQGSAADQMKRAMVRLNRWFAKLRKKMPWLDIHIVLTIHDELVFEVKKEHAFKWLLRGICEIMSDHEGHFGIPTPVEMEKCTVNWSKKEKLGWDPTAAA